MTYEEIVSLLLKHDHSSTLSSLHAAVDDEARDLAKNSKLGTTPEEFQELAKKYFSDDISSFLAGTMVLDPEILIGMRERYAKSWALAHIIQRLVTPEESEARKKAMDKLEEAGLNVTLSNPDPESFFTGQAKNWDRRPKQTGMERKHEAWVLAMINFLGQLNIPMWDVDEHGNRIRGGTFELPHRMDLALGKFHEVEGRAIEASKRGREIWEKHNEIERLLRLLQDVILPERGKANLAKAQEMLENHFEEKGDPRDKLERDENGMAKMRLDVRDVFYRLGMDNLAHDFASDERLCQGCWGLGIVKREGPYGLGDRKPGEPSFPFKHQWLDSCPNCYMGKERFCTLEGCGKTLPRSRTVCDCEGARHIQMVSREKKEAERREKVSRIPLSEYGYDMLFADQSNRFISVDEAEEFLEEYPDEVFFACKPAPAACIPDAGGIIEDIKEQAFDQAGPENDDDDLVEFKDGAVDHLAAHVGAWFEEFAVVRDLWWQNDNLIVEVKRG
jgi:hypothetical protein